MKCDMCKDECHVGWLYVPADGNRLWICKWCHEYCSRAADLLTDEDTIKPKPKLVKGIKLEVGNKIRSKCNNTFEVLAIFFNYCWLARLDSTDPETWHQDHIANWEVIE